MVVTLLPMHDEAFTTKAQEGLASQLGDLDKLLLNRLEAHEPPGAWLGSGGDAI